MEILGLRVFPGPSWQYDKDFNFLGTVTKIDEYSKAFVTVQWDNGNYNNYGIGKEERYDLLIYDSGPTGIRHVGYNCKGCNYKDITGIKWGCIECRNFLCTKCYMANCDSTHHYYRVDSRNEIGSFVGKRVNDLKVKCQGIFQASQVQLCCTLYGVKKGTVDSFLDKDDKYRSLVNVKMEKDNKLKKRKIGFKGEMEVHLVNTDNDPRNMQDIYRNHLRILGRHPIFNYEFSKLYEKDLKNFHLKNFELIEGVRNFRIHDVVYVDCFDFISLQSYQNGFGESNDKVEMLIGKHGTIKSIEEERVKVYFENLNEELFFNPEILLNLTNSEMKMVRISDTNNLTNTINEWKGALTTEKIKDIYWMPDDEIIKRISNKIGVIFTNILPGNLVGVQFKMYPHRICMILPRKVCMEMNMDIDETSDTSEELSNEIPMITNLDLNSPFEEENIERGRILISSKNAEEFKKWIANFNIDMTNNEWCKLAILAAKSENIDIISALLEKNISKDQNSLLNEIICLKCIDRNITMSQKVLEFIISHLNFGRLPINNHGENVLHIASKKNDIDVVELILKKKKELVDSINKLNGYSALHYAVENNNYLTIDLLMKYDCNIYLQDTTSGSTALHLALNHCYVESLCHILGLLKNKLNTTVVNNNGDCILHLSASVNFKDYLDKWNQIIKEKHIDLIKDLIEKFQKWKSVLKSKYFDDVDITEMPFAILSSLILSKGENAYQTWIGKLNKNHNTPKKLFDESVKKLKLSSHNIYNSFHLFYQYLGNEHDSEVCKFCYINCASVTYEPCGHKIHCEYCSFMPYKCSTCNEDILNKLQDKNKKLITYESWMKLSESVKDEKCPESLADWYNFVSKTIKYLECNICFSNNWNIVFDCGHQLCSVCLEKSKICPQCNKDNPKFFKLKGND